MNKTIKILIPIILAIAILVCMAWYLFIYDRMFTRDVLLACARFNESHGNHQVATWFYNLAYTQADNSDEVAIELAEQYKSIGNFTKAEFTLSNAIADGGGIDLYVALSKTYVQQDKLLDAVNMLNNVTNPEVKTKLEAMRPDAPKATPEPGYYSQYISVTFQAEGGTIYAASDGTYPSVSTDLYKESLPLPSGESTIYAVTVAENGLVSKASIFGYTIGGVIEKVGFADSAVEAEVRKLLNVNEETEIFTDDLWTLNTFTMPAGAKSYADLKHMIFLENLTISDGVGDELKHLSALVNLKVLKITNTGVSQDTLKTISSFTKLSELTLNNCGISSITPLSSCINITKLDLSNNAIVTVNALSALTQLEELNLSSNTVTNISPLSAVTAIKTLDISSNAISSLTPLSGLTRLTWVDASTNQITEIGELSQLSALTYLALNSNQLTSLSGLEACSALEELSVSSNTLTNITAAAGLQNLMRFDFSYNQVADLPQFQRTCSLVTIDGSSNQLSSLDALSGLESLNNVHMDYNTEISSVKALADCPVLIEVNVYATKVTDVTALTNQSIIVNFNPVQ